MNDLKELLAFASGCSIAFAATATDPAIQASTGIGGIIIVLLWRKAGKLAAKIAPATTEPEE